MNCSNKKNCSCTYPCSRRGNCCECVAYHNNRNEIPACFFSKKAEAKYDRSIEAFIADKTNE
ncbi:DUF6485 family protein [bacterium]